MMKLLPILLVLALATTASFASDGSPLQDFCVGVNSPKDGLFINGKFCKDPSLVTADDFAFTAFRYPGNTSNELGSFVTAAFAGQFLAVNTLGVSMGRIDFAVGGLNAPHIHPRASEILHVSKGTLLAGFVASNEGNNRLYAKVLFPGDIFVFPVGLIHFQINIGKTTALAFPSFNSQNPGIITVARTIFGSVPGIPADVLTKAFQIDKKLVKHLQTLNWPN